jgi:hypothetical protein
MTDLRMSDLASGPDGLVTAQEGGRPSAIAASIAVIQADKAARRNLPFVHVLSERENCPNSFCALNSGTQLRVRHFT